ncbi:MAG TPA: hypothetical protein VMS17_06585 [Gemmataceae bacterium]|nr:hypothetical protein [Gemmataceae bacterium]
MRTVWLGACACVLAGLASSAFGQTADAPLDPNDFAADVQPRVHAVIDQPTLTAHGPREMFTCQPSMYRRLIDHPDQTVRLWRRLGAKCIEVQDGGGGRFAWQEGVSEVHWEVILDGPTRRVWYAEGQVKPALLIPAVPVKALLVLDYVEGKDGAGRPAVRHQMQLILHTDSRVMALATKMMGDSAPKTAEKFLAQLQMFYAAMAWYLDQHPDKAEKMFASLGQPDPPDSTLHNPIPPRSPGDPQGPDR